MASKHFTSKYLKPFGSALICAIILLFWLTPLLHPILNYDEISAVIRAENAHNFKDNILQGVIPDGHPGGLQTIIYFISQIIGFQPLLLKLLAVTLALLASIQGYLLGKEFHSKSAGVSVLIFLSLWWWNLSIGSMARPYSIALPFVLLSWRWALKLLQKLQQSTQSLWQTAIAWAVWISLSGYFHHFAFLFALLSVLFFLLSVYLQHKTIRQALPPLAITIISIVILYIPNFVTLQQQLSNRGLGWLSTPTPDFLLLFFQRYMGNYLSLILLASIALAVYFKPEKSIMLLLIFFINYLILHIYSCYRSPVLQPSALYFSIPILWLTGAMGLAELLKKLNTRWELIWLSLLSTSMALNTWVKHQWLGEAQKNYHAEFAKEFFQNPKTTWANIDADILTFYAQHYHTLTPKESRILIQNNGQIFQHEASFIARLKSLHPKQHIQLCLQANSAPWIRPLFQLAFDSVRVQHQYIGGYTLMGMGYNPNRLHATFQNNYPLPLISMKHLVSENDQLSFHAQFHLSDFQPQSNDLLIVITPTLLGEAIPDEGSEIVSTLYNGNNQIDWRSTKMEAYQQLQLPYAIHSIKLSDIPSWNMQTRLGLDIPFESAWVGILPGNPYQYGIWEN